MTTPLSGKIFYRLGGTCYMVSQYTKFEVSRFTRYEATNGECRKWGVWGGYGSLKVIGNVTIQ